MSSQTRIIVLKMRSVIYTGVFIFLLLAVGILLFIMFGKNGGGGQTTSPVSVLQSSISISPATQKSAKILYEPGSYNSILKLGDHTIGVNVTVSSDRIQSITLDQLTEELANAYPLLEPAVTQLNEQIQTTQSIDYIVYDENMHYTQDAILQSVSTALKKAAY